MSGPPLVAVTATTEVLRGKERVRVNAAYTAALELAGAVPLIVPPLSDPSRAGAILDRADALLLTGGEDVDPRRYGAARHPAVGGVHAGRDATELALAAAARERRLPTLAICRGIQLLNVALGGTLVQDLPTERPEAIDHDTRQARDRRVHEVLVAPGSRLAAVLGDTRLTVNSFHHQAVDRAADGLAVTARAPDGVIEGAEWTGDDWWALAVQWHPEELVRGEEPWDRRLFEAFVRVAATTSATATRHAPDASAGRASDGAGRGASR